MTDAEPLAFYKEQYNSAYASLFRFSQMDMPLSAVAGRAAEWIKEHTPERHGMKYLPRSDGKIGRAMKRWHLQAQALDSLPAAVRLAVLEADEAGQ